MLHAVRTRRREYPRKPDGKKNKRKRLEAKRRKVKRIGPQRYLDQKESPPQLGQREAKLSRPRKKPRRV